jgi:hypothetical protein
MLYFLARQVPPAFPLSFAPPRSGGWDQIILGDSDYWRYCSAWREFAPRWIADFEITLKSIMAEKARAPALFRRRTIRVPTWRGCVVLFLVLLAVGTVFLKTIHPFLAMNQPLDGGVLAVEGWLGDNSLKVAADKIKEGVYQRIYVTGGPLEQGAPLSRYQTYAQLGRATLEKLGVGTNVMQAVPSIWVRQDRTYASAKALRRSFEEDGLHPQRLTILTDGAHARRSRLIFKKALGTEVTVGVISVPPISYDPARWWRSSAGFRTVTDEMIAYVYARLFFHPSGKDAD